MKQTKAKYFTSKTFAETFGYNWSYVRKMLKGLPDFRTGNSLHLPEGFTAEKIGRDWLIFPTKDGAIRNLLRRRK
jgi:hypothetical protein